MPIKYRADIDGLRAIAVTTVVLFHLGFQSFGGGFIGVDVFFVISGFLITNLIRNEVLDTGTFSFTNFYIRRARRLFPSLFVTFVLCGFFAIGLFTPQHLERFGGALLHAVTSVSNIYFWTEAGYFDAEKYFKPLLHTWSLSVEEQFYIIWPVLLVFSLVKGPRYTTQVMLISFGLLSFFLNYIFIDNAYAIFFLTPFRIFEFAIGAIMVWLIQYRPNNLQVLEICVPVGLSMIAYAAVFYSDTILFPYYNALLPCVGTALIIFGGESKYSGYILRNQAMVALGKISYSLYLIHWPIIVFYKYWTFENLGRPEQIIIGMVSILFAALMYKYVEQPFRQGKLVINRWSGAGFGFICAFLALLIALPAANIWANNGWPWRLPDQIVQALNQNWKSESAGTQKYARIHDRQDTAMGDILFIGDSYMGDLFGSVYVQLKKAGKSPDAFFFDDQCLPFLTLKNGKLAGLPIVSSLKRKCSRSFKRLGALEAKIRISKTVVFHSRWGRGNVKYVENFYQYCKAIKPNCQLLVLSQRAEWRHVPTMVTTMYSNFNRDVINGKSYYKRSPGIERTNNLLEALATKLNFGFIDMVSLMCDGKSKSCDVLDNNMNLLIYDQGHWSSFGQQFWGNQLMEIPKFKSALKLN